MFTAVVGIDELVIQFNQAKKVWDLQLYAGSLVSQKNLRFAATLTCTR